MKNRRKPSILDVLAEMEPSFQRMGPDIGRFPIHQFPVSVNVHHDALNWCTFTLLLPPPGGLTPENDATSFFARLLEAHHSIEVPVKFAHGHHLGHYHLVGEVPVNRAADAIAIEAMLAGIRDGLAQGTSAFASLARHNRDRREWEWPQERPDKNTDQGCALEGVHEQIAEFLAQWGREWAAQETGFLVTLDTQSYFQKIEIHTKRKGVVYFQSQLTEFTEEALSGASRTALTDLLFDVNYRLRLARASIIGTWEEGQGPDTDEGGNGKKAVVLEVATRGDTLSPVFMEQALSSLLVAARFTTLEVQALCSEDIARAYLHFKHEGRSSEWHRRR